MALSINEEDEEMLEDDIIETVNRDIDEETLLVQRPIVSRPRHLKRQVLKWFKWEVSLNQKFEF